MRTIGWILSATAVVVSASVAVARPETEIKIAGVPAKVQKIALKVKGEELQETLNWAQGGFGYEIAFGKLKEAQFKALVAYFRKIEPLKYDAGTAYKIADFLPGKMQALLNKRLQSPSWKSEELADSGFFYKSGGEVMSTINCWGTAWELSRDPSVKTPLVTFMMGRHELGEKLREASQQIQATQMTFGDLLIFNMKPMGTEVLLHAALVIGHGYYFERTDSGSAPFFRIVHLDDMKARIKESLESAIDNEGNPMKFGFELRRLTKPLPMPQDVFAAVHSREEVKEFVDAIPPNFDRSKITIFADDGMGGVSDLSIYEIVPIKFKLNANGRAEPDPADPGAKRILPSER